MIAIQVTTEDQAATFVATHQPALWRWLRALGCERAHAEEHIQDALLAGLDNAVDRLPEPEARRWLRVAARNLFLMRLRAERRRPMVVDPDLVEAGWQRVRGDEDGGAAAMQALAQCLQALPERDRLAIDLRYRERAARRAMAERLGLGEAGVKMALRRARMRLRACIERRLTAEEQS